MHPNDAELLEYVEGELETKASDQVRRHLESCPDCAALVRLAEAGRAELRAAPQLTLRPERRDAILASLPAQEHVARERRGLAAWLTPKRALAILAPTAAAAALAVAIVNADVDFSGGEDAAAPPAEPAPAEPAAEAAAPAEAPAEFNQEAPAGAAEAAVADEGAEASNPASAGSATQLPAPAEPALAEPAPAPAEEPAPAPAEPAPAAPPEAPSEPAPPAEPAAEPAPEEPTPPEPTPPSEPAPEAAPPPGTTVPEADPDARLVGPNVYVAVDATVAEVLALLAAGDVEAADLSDGRVGVGDADPERVRQLLSGLPEGELEVVGKR